MAFLIILQVKGCILEGEIREQTLCTHAAGKLEQVIVGFAGVEVYAILHTENLDGEDSSFAVAQPCLCHQKHIFHNHAPLCGGIHAVVDGGEGGLRTCTAVHGVEVMQQCLHCLIGCLIGFLGCLFRGEGLNLVQNFFGYACLQKQLLFSFGVCLRAIQCRNQIFCGQCLEDFLCFFRMRGAVHHFN